MTDLILYTTEDGRNQIKLRADQQTVWLTQSEMAELFDATKQNISLHLKNLFKEGELNPEATVKDSLTVQLEGSRRIRRMLILYNLDAILAVGYRVRSSRGAQFRRWASTILKEYLQKGFVMDDERLKNREFTWMDRIHRIYINSSVCISVHPWFKTFFALPFSFHGAFLCLQRFVSLTLPLRRSVVPFA